MRISQLLVDRGADVNHVNSAGHSVLHVAFQFGHIPCAQFLLSVGARKCPIRCLKCQLSLKMLDRRAAKAAAEEAAAAANRARIEAERRDRAALVAELGDVNLGDELAKLSRALSLRPGTDGLATKARCKGKSKGKGKGKGGRKKKKGKR